MSLSNGEEKPVTMVMATKYRVIAVMYIYWCISLQNST